MKSNYIKDLSEIKNFTDKIKTMRESISFEDNIEESGDMFDDEFETEEEQDSDRLNFKNEKTNDEIVDYVGKIRGITLMGMMKFHNNPDNEQYQTLKKIFQMCDKTPQKEINNNNRAE